MSYFRTLIPMIIMCIVAVSIKETINNTDMFIGGMIMLTIVFCTAEIRGVIREKRGEP